MQLNRSTFYYFMCVLLVLLLACKSGANSSFEAKRASDWKKYQKSKPYVLFKEIEKTSIDFNDYKSNLLFVNIAMYTYSVYSKYQLPIGGW